MAPYYPQQGDERLGCSAYRSHRPDLQQDRSPIGARQRTPITEIPQISPLYAVRPAKHIIIFHLSRWVVSSSETASPKRRHPRTMRTPCKMRMPSRHRIACNDTHRPAWRRIEGARKRDRADKSCVFPEKISTADCHRSLPVRMCQRWRWRRCRDVGESWAPVFRQWCADQHQRQ